MTPTDAIPDNYLLAVLVVICMAAIGGFILRHHLQVRAKLKAAKE